MTTGVSRSQLIDPTPPPILPREPMPRFMTIHRAPGLLEEQWVESSVEVYAAQHATFVQAHVNLTTGFLFTIYDAVDREHLVEQFEALGFPYDEIHEIQLSQSFEEMKAMLQKLGRI
jgi:hypothetical protein